VIVVLYFGKTMKKLQSNLFIVVLLIGLVYGCLKNSTESQNNNEVIRGTIKLNSGQGFDFSTQRLVKEDVNLIDLYISFSQDIKLIGSPVGFSFVDPYTGGIFFIVEPDPDMPAIKELVENQLDNITEISQSGFVPIIDKLNTNFVYAVKNQDLKYSIFTISQIDTLSDTKNILIDWRYQPDGSNRFK
jgi:hypothetical protein